MDGPCLAVGVLDDYEERAEGINLGNIEVDCGRPWRELLICECSSGSSKGYRTSSTGILVHRSDGTALS